MNIQDIVLESEYNVLMSLSKSYEKEFLMESYYMEADAGGREIWTSFGYTIRQSDLADGSIPQIDLKSLCKWAFDCFEATYFNNAHETNGEWDVTAASGDYALLKRQLTELVSIDNIPVIRKE